MFSFFKKWFWDLENPKKTLEKSEMFLKSPLEDKMLMAQQDFDKLKETTKSLTETAESLSRELKRKLQLAEAKFDFVENHVEDLIVVKTSNRKIININDYACKLFGFKREDCLGKTNEELIENFPKLEEILKVFSKNEEKALKNNKLSKFDVQIPFKKEKIKLRICINPIETDDLLEKEIIIIGYIKK